MSAHLLAMFEGDKDSRHNVGIAFGSIFEALEEVAKDIESLDIHRPEDDSAPTSTTEAVQDDDEGMIKILNIGLLIRIWLNSEYNYSLNMYINMIHVRYRKVIKL